ncbi:hypothetical protein C0Q70_08555 [Pomacea canaliculata]|uniref:RING-type domain-containing protein n=1 Tax=Pomacea canaliculata TaxID=400727 RepID=A0A2T7PI52_POMCA|nr:hypothetical protein C0Q70_08555 [Pomacea canaliculata]
MSTTMAGNKLAQEIHDEFLTCKICLEGFKSPKSLDCLHTFCEQCIENHVVSECSYKKYTDYREFTCPLCRKRTQLPLGGVKKLPDNFLACVDLHHETKVTKDHSLFDCEIEKDIECKEHQDEVVRFFCEPCETCICVLCTFNEHKDHEITQFSEAVCKYKEDIQELLRSCKSKIEIYDTQLALLSRCELIIKEAEQRIHDVAIQFIADIRSREKQLVDDLHALYGSELMEYVNRKSEMQSNLDSLKSTCSLTELVLKGKDIELLLLKKQVQDKLGCLSEVTLKDLPRSVYKQVSFVPGSMDLGALCDPERPPRLQTQISLPASLTSGGSSGAHIRTTETQTDLTSQRDSRMHVATGTDLVCTQEKAVNTRSRALHQLHSAQAKEETPEDAGGGGGGTQESAASPLQRQHRRRRERIRPVEVGVRPTTFGPTMVVASPEGYGPVLTYSSSIEENHYTSYNPTVHTSSPPT